MRLKVKIWDLVTTRDGFIARCDSAFGAATDSSFLQGRQRLLI